MKTENCVELKNRIQAEILRDYAALPKNEWARRQAEDLAKSQRPIADLWRRIQPAAKRETSRVAEPQAGYPAQSQR